MSLIRVRNLWKEYADTVVLEDINLDIEERAFVALVGPSGCGKTTFLKLLLSEEIPTRGIIELDGKPVPAEPGPERGVVYQRYSVFPHLTVLGNVVLASDLGARTLGARLTGRLSGARRRAAVGKAREMLDAVGLAAAADSYPSALSGGMQQRLALAQALMAEPRVLLLDEPFGALDPGIRADIHVLMRRLWHERALTAVMVTHDLSEAFGLATRVIAFERRREHDAANARFGARIARDISIWPPRIAGQPTPFSRPGRPGAIGSRAGRPAPSEA